MSLRIGIEKKKNRSEGESACMLMLVIIGGYW
ncbi:hypothetical protein HMPREF9714_00844 [Myroides odoratimimus CCUG 12901]|uniref:Uncharacterized protein n=1 Tax=Myroides odoratimimus CIP 101113 TaxID=883154 RepID=A0AAV3F5S9_9FLAO|nr:hypothetical protein HMPREF9714_00844 [Myroides odoratimimus CCUG 12901]EHO14176.1 hypothetical protein HMPREF9715_00847 [Myroides odoratimimus CIP 101113]STZ47465.1 Uncharacterised protein [Myroides odoratimimus]